MRCFFQGLLFIAPLFVTAYTCVSPLNVPATEVMKFIVSAGVIDIESENAA